jgi:adenosine kinase
VTRSSWFRPKIRKSQAKHVASATKYGLKLIYDPSQQTTTVPASDLIAGVKAATILMSNQFELSQIITRTGFSESEINAFVPVTITTLGENGSLIQGRVVKTSIHVAAVAVPAVVDPTGAGDSYRAGFIYGYTLDLTWRPAAKWAVALPHSPSNIMAP